MTNKQIHTALIKPNAEIVVIPSDLERRSKFCLKVNGISAKKKNNISRKYPISNTYWVSHTFHKWNLLGQFGHIKNIIGVALSELQHYI